jgi:hypothetical protein
LGSATVASVPRNYTLVAIKTLFGEASACAYPGCEEPLVFRDRGVVTVVAEIAHIRSEKPGGPRHDPDYRGDVNGPDNLLLLCGKHHRPVDRHEVVYTIEELETWKEAQRLGADGGTPISADEARLYVRLTDEERAALTQLARLAERVIATSEKGQLELDDIEAAYQEVRRSAQHRMGPIWEVDDDGNRTLINDRIELPHVEQMQWSKKAQDALVAHRDRVSGAVGALREEIAVLRMMGGASADGSEQVAAAAESVAGSVGDRVLLIAAIRAMNVAVAQMWRIATGEIE